TLDELRTRAQVYVAAIPSAAVAESTAYIGGGALPAEAIPSIAVALESRDADGVAAGLRRGEPAVVARIAGGRVLLDLRTIAPEEDAAAIAAVRSLPPS